MEELGGCRGVADVHVVFGRQHHEPLDASGGVLGALSLEAVGQQHDQATVLVPLVLCGDDELVDDDLGSVGEVAELGFPQHECLRVRDRIAVLEAEHGVLAQQRVVHPEVRPVALAQFLERGVFGTGFVIDEGRMSMAERAAARVLAGEAHRGALDEKTAVGHRLAKRPVDLAALEHTVACRELLGELRMHREARGGRGEDVVDLVDHCLVDRRTQMRPDAAALDRPLSDTSLGSDLARLVERRLQPGAEVVECCLFIVGGEGSTLHERRGVQLPDRGSFVDPAVHLGERVAGVVAFVVTVTSVADHVDHDVLVELLAVLERQSGDPDTGFWIVAVHMEDRGLDHLGHVGGVLRRTSCVRRRGETDLVVDHDVHAAADSIPADLRQVEGLGDDTLTGERCVAVQ